MKRKVLIQRESVGGYSVSVPALVGCHSQGETVEEALTNIREAAELWLEVATTATAAQAQKADRAQPRDIDLGNRFSG